MSAAGIKTRSEQRLEQLESIDRRLTDAEHEEVRRCEHAIYMHHWRAAKIEKAFNAPILKQHAAEEADLLERVEREIVGTKDERVTDYSQETPRFLPPRGCSTRRRGGIES